VILKGAAEGNFKVLNLHASVEVPRISSRQAVLTKEWTPLEAGVIDHKTRDRHRARNDGQGRPRAPRPDLRDELQVTRSST
jgi:hypothetical protein